MASDPVALSALAVQAGIASRTRRASRALAVAVLSALAVPASVCVLGDVAHAEPTSADREQARSLMQEGRDLRDKGHAQDALKRFKAADEIMHVPTTGLEVARTQASLGMFMEARDTIAAIRKLPTGPSDPAPFMDARNKAEELDNQLEAKIPSITITVTGGAEGETPSITVDGVSVPSAAMGLPRRVNSGKHMISARTPSGHGEQTVEVHEGDRKEVQIALTGGAAPEPAATEPEPGQTPKETPVEPSGPKSHSPTVLTWVGVGVAGAGAIAGVVTGVMSMSLTSQLKNNHECKNSVCYAGTTGGNDYSSATSLATISDVTWALAGVGAAVAVASILIGHEADAEKKAPESSPAPSEGGEPPAGDTPPASQSRLRVVPWVGLGSAGVVGVF
jgi:hypothetical protein